jgi:hypothetical protein
MTARKKASPQGAYRVASQLDALADLFTHHRESLWVSEKVANDFLHRCDLLSDHLDRTFGLRVAGYYNPAEIGEEVPGPLIMDSNNPFMNGHFTQERFTELAEKQMSGSLAQNAANHTADPVRLAKLVAREAAKLAFSQLQDWAIQDRVRKEASKKAKKSEEEDEKKEAKKSDAKPFEGKETPEEEAMEKKVLEEQSKKAADAFGLFATK